MHDICPETTAALFAKLRAYECHPCPPIGHVDVPTTPGLAGQKMAALLRADYPPISTSQQEDVRALTPDFINLGEQWLQDADPIVVFHGYLMLLMVCGMALGLRRVPFAIVATFGMHSKQGDDPTESMRVNGRIIAGLLREVYPPTSDEELQLLVEGLPGFIDYCERMSRDPQPENSTVGNALLGIALGISIGLFKVPMTVTMEFMPKQ